MYEWSYNIMHALSFVFTAFSREPTKQERKVHEKDCKTDRNEVKIQRRTASELLCGLKI